jgi:hypothetical protein
VVVCCWLAVGIYGCVFWETLPSLLKCNLQIMSIDCFCFGKLLGLLKTFSAKKVGKVGEM